MYSYGDDNTHMGYNHKIAMANNIALPRSITKHRKVCEQLDLKVGTSEIGQVKC